MEEKGQTLESFASEDASKNSVFDKSSETWMWVPKEEIGAKEIRQTYTDCQEKVYYYAPLPIDHWS